MKKLLPMLALLCACSQPQQQTENLKKVALPSGCTEERAFREARSQMYIGLKNPESSTIDSLKQAFISTSNDTTTVIVHAIAPNAFGVKENISLTAFFLCRNDSLLWLNGMLGNTMLDLSGRPVDAAAGMKWDNDRHTRMMKQLGH